MKQEDKELLLKDLCARLPYGIKCNIGEEASYTLCRIEVDDMNGHLLDFIETKNGLDVQVYLSECMPYLFPLSSMTEEQKKEYHSIIYRSIELHYNEYCDVIDIDFFDVLQEFYLKNHFDYRGLIEKGLAIDCSNLNIY